MPLAPGTKLGPYEITAAVGAGGMGEVYKAKDTRLGRTVAIKVLPSHLKDNPELRQRLEREARAVSSLNHPHICTLHDIGEQDGTEFLVMEFVEGETLAERLKKSALDSALRYAVEIADALEKAHRQGVVHRDLKPGNIMITKDDGAKLLDFGLAKISDSPGLGEGGSALPTQEKPLTEKGAILGTFQYMAPEQLEGKEADTRTDVFAFGSVLYEMVSGQRAFEGGSQASLIAAIMSSDPPPIRSIEPLTPPVLDKTIRTCLEKDPDDRWQTFTDLKREIVWIAEGDTASEKPLPTARPKRLAWAAGVLAAVAVAGIIGWSLKAPEPPLVTHLRMSLEPADRLQSSGRFHRPSRTAFAISPDGRHIVFSGQAGGVTQLYRRALDQAQAVPIPDTEDGVNPFFSPDGQWIAFFASGLLKKVLLSGGTVATLCDISANGFYGGSWGDDGHIIFALQGGGLSRVSASGGEPLPLTTLDTDEGETSHRLPFVLPGAQAVLFTSLSGGGTRVAVESLETGERRLLVEDGSDARYLRTGHLVYMKSGTLMSEPFDPHRLTVTGPSIPLLEEVMHARDSTTPVYNTRAAQFSVSDSGHLVFLSGGVYPEERRFVTWVDRTGNEERWDLPLRHYVGPLLSPDGQRLAVRAGRGSDRNVFLIDRIRGTTTRLTTSGKASQGTWTPDGNRYCFASTAQGSYWREIDLSGDIEPLTKGEYRHFPSSWTPDGKILAYVEMNPDTGRDIWLLNIKNGGEPRPLMQTPAHEEYPEFSPNGRWLAYMSDESGQDEIYVQSFPDSGQKYQISADGGREPLWSRNGKELFYRRDEQVWAASIETDSRFTAGRPKVLFKGAYIRSYPVRCYDISADGKRFLMVGREPFPDTPITHLNVVLNWHEELKRLVPAN